MNTITLSMIEHVKLVECRPTGETNQRYMYTEWSWRYIKVWRVLHDFYGLPIRIVHFGRKNPSQFITFCTTCIYRESLWFWYILIYSTYSLIIPKKFELRDIPFLFYHCQFISMKIVTCRGRGEGGGGKEKRG